MWSVSWVKVGFWIVLILAVTPSLLVIGGTLFGELTRSEDPDHVVVDTSLQQGEMFVVTHHAGWFMGPITLSFYPRVWAASLGAVGFVFLVASLVVLLHVPIPHHDLP